jgi:hypothetical protein
MARRAADLCELPSSHFSGFAHLWIFRSDLDRHWQRCLENNHCGYVSSRHLVGEPVAIRVRSHAYALCWLYAVMLVESVVREFAKRNDSAGLMEGANDQAGRVVRAAGGEAHRRNTLHAARVPASVDTARNHAEANSFTHEHARLARRSRFANGL